LFLFIQAGRKTGLNHFSCGGVARTALAGRRATLDDNTISVPTAVPEPGTLVSGAMLLLPFGSSTLRLLRRRQAV